MSAATRLEMEAALAKHIAALSETETDMLIKYFFLVENGSPRALRLKARTDLTLMQKARLAADNR